MYLLRALGPINANLIAPAGVYFFRILGAASVIWLFQMNEQQRRIREKYAQPFGSHLKHTICRCSSLIWPAKLRFSRLNWCALGATGAIKLALTGPYKFNANGFALYSQLKRKIPC